jgi:MFS superfamily sulfate permease-like transporter
LIAVILSLVALVWRSSQSKLSVLGREPGKFTLSDIRRHPDNHRIPGLLIVRPDEGIFFANAESLYNEIIALAESTQPPVKVVLLDLEMSNQFDVPSVDLLVELKTELDQRAIELWLARVHGPVRGMLERSGFIQQLGPEKIHARSLDSILEYLSQVAPDQLEKAALVSDGLKLTMEVIDVLLSQSSSEQHEVMEYYRQKLSEINTQTKQ